MRRTIAIDFLPESVERYWRSHSIVAVDVIRATTTAVSAVAAGRTCYLAASADEAARLAGRLDNPLLVGELDGTMPDDFHITNSPAALAVRDDVERPIVLLSSSGTKLLGGAKRARAAYAACLRNVSAQVDHLGEEEDGPVAVIGAGSRGQFRREDQLCCARIAGGLIDAGFEPADERTSSIVERWRDAPDDAFVGGASTEYLRRSGQLHDLDFILEHVDDLDETFVVEGDELVQATRSARR
jgi:2-phosphosulfolactate phosphatase